MAFPTTSVLDNFNRANGALGAPNWTQGVYETGQSNLAIATNVVDSDGSGATVRAHAYWSAATFGPDCECYADVPTLGTQVVSVFARLQQPGGATCDGYMVRRNIGGPFYEVNRLDNGASTQLGATVSGTFSSGDTLGIGVAGNTISLYQKTSGIWSPAPLAGRTDSTYPSAGNIGAEVWSGSTLDNFGGGTIVSGPPPTLWVQPVRMVGLH